MTTQRNMRRLKKDLIVILEDMEEFDKEDWDILSAKTKYEDRLVEAVDEFCKKLDEFDENCVENEENENFLEQLHETKQIAKKRLTAIKTKIKVKEKQMKNEMEEKEKQRKIELDEKERQRRIEIENIERQRKHEIELKKIEMEEKERQHRIEMEEKERQQRIEMEEKERQSKIEMEKRKLEKEERLQYETIQLEKLKIEQNIKAKREKSQGEESSHTPIHSRSAISAKLPKLELKTFDGDILKWQEFWDAFESTVHHNERLRNVDRFNYLRVQLVGQASGVISGLELTNENYETAVKLLHERYGKKDIMREAHHAQLLRLPPAQASVTSLRVFYDKTETHLRALQSLGVDTDNNGHLLSTIKSKLPGTIIAELAKMKQDESDEWTVVNFQKRFQRYLSAQEEAQIQQQFYNQPDTTLIDTHMLDVSRSNYKFTGEALLSSETNRQKGEKRTYRCIFCDGKHWSDECRQYPDSKTRKEKLRGRCYICLRSDHQVTNCRSKDRKCAHCGDKGKHHRSLCSDKFGKTTHHNQNVSENANIVAEEDQIAPESSLVAIGEKVIMQTAFVTVMDCEQSAFKQTRILLDTGSQRSYITKELADHLNLKTTGEHTYSVYTFGNKKPKEITTSEVELKIKTRIGKYLQIKASIVPQITGLVQRTPINLKYTTMIQRTYQLADTLPTHLETSQLGILIGNDYYNDIMMHEKEKIQDGLYLLKSHLGWILSGRISTQYEKSPENVMLMMTQTVSQLPSEVVYQSLSKDPVPIETNAADFWSLELIGIKPIEENQVDSTIMEQFKRTISKKDGRYQVRWPWREQNVNLPINYELSLGRLKSLMKRFHGDPELLRKYDQIIQDQLKKGIIEKVTDDNSHRKHYIPHHAIFNPEKPTTKLRVVYDASAKTKKGNKSLNECLHRGPTILEDLCSLLLRFRTKEIGIIADIEKAFLQVSIQKEDRDVTRFLWVKDIQKKELNENIETYRFTRVPFGIISSPFLLAGTVRHHLEQVGSSTSRQIRDDIYVDNIVTGVSDEKEAIKLYREGKEIFKNASMNLREWLSNSKTVNDIIKPEDRLNERFVKVLGLRWDTLKDEMSVSMKKIGEFSEPTTKRQILAMIASIFDPLGFLTPSTLTMKLFLQELWEKGKDWDDPLSECEILHWRKIISDLDELSTTSIPRFIGNGKSELLCFCDASSKAYATVIYLRTMTAGKIQTNLIFSKARNAPIKTLTIPRLELLSVLIGVRSLKFVEKSLKLNITDRILWTDSQCVLKWIQVKENQCVFVRNRIKEIIADDSIYFRYINTKENPADLPTRGVTSQELKHKKLWWYGPGWVNLNRKSWPSWNISEIDISQIKDRENKHSDGIIYEISGAVTEAHSIKQPYGIDENNISSLKKLLNVTAYVKRFLDKSRKQTTASGPLTAEEVMESEQLWIRYIQEKCLMNRNKQLKNEIHKSQLNPKISSHGIVRVYGRLQNADLPEETISPILLPRGENLTRKIIEDTHKRIHHSGVSHTLASLRTKYWIPQGRSEVKKILRQCLICIRHQGGPYKIHPMAPWPKTKVSESPAFTNIGIDYFGPLYVKNCNNYKKNWVCIFTCISVRAIHLELVDDMSTEEFLAALRRFIARRGTPSLIISDNAQQFKLASSTLDIGWQKVVHDPEVQTYSSNQRIKWNFIVELSPWMGGFYERLIGVTKRALKKTIGKISLARSQLETILVEIEAIINTRPLLYVSEDLNQDIIITPMHFLSINTKVGIPTMIDRDENNDPDYLFNERNSAQVLLEKWKKGQRHLEQFWEIWRSDYLLSLRERSQRFRSHPRVQSQKQPKVGDIVQIKDDGSRGTWKIGRIVEFLRSTDGLERAAKVQLPTKSILQRSIGHLYPLECENDDPKMGILKKTPTNTSKEKDDPMTIEPRKRTTRKAAFEARDKIVGQTLLDNTQNIAGGGSVVNNHEYS